MNITQLLRTLFLLALLLAVCSSGSASSLQGKVAEVVDGESISVISQNHPVKVRLVGVVAPEKSQSFAGIARQHLADLIFDKYVVVRVTSLRDGYLVGQVQFGDMDVCAQMLRDGVGWYNKSDESNLNEVERQLYQASQDAARAEHRGLWQEASPQAPWDVHKAPLVTTNTSAVSLSRQPATLRRGSQAGLSSEDLMGGFMQPGSMTVKPNVRQLSTEGAQDHWLKYQPADRHFSISAPSDGIEVSYQVLAPQGQLIDIHLILGVKISSKTIYVLSWAKGPNGSLTDASAIADAVAGFLNEVNHVRQQYGEILITATPGRSLKLAGYDGREYALATRSNAGVIRVLSKQIGTDREVFMLGVLTTPGTPASGDEFLNSFKIK